MKLKYIFFLVISFTQLKTISQSNTIVIDPGHGYCIGDNCPGNTEIYNGVTVYNPDGRCMHEIETALAVSYLLKDKLESSCPNITVFLTREQNVVNNNDQNADPDKLFCSDIGTWMDVDDRACFSNRKNADLFISLHTNACGTCTICNDNAPGDGTETFYCELFHSGTNPHISADMAFGDLVNSKIVQFGQVDDRHEQSVERNSTYGNGHLGVLRFNQTPYKVLNEIGFHTNQEDRLKLLSDFWRERFAQGLFEAITENLDINNLCSNCIDINEPNNISQTATPLTQFGKCFDTQNAIQAGLDLTTADEDWYLLGINDLGVLDITLASPETNVFIDLLDTNGNVVESGSSINGTVTLNWSGGGNSCLPLYIRVESNQSANDCYPYSLIIDWNAEFDCSPNFTSSPQVLSINGETEYCEGETVNLSVSGGSGNHTWYLNNTLVAQGITYTDNSLSQGMYIITVIDNETTCDLISEELVITNEVNANAGQDETINQGGNTQLQGSGGSSYSWSPPTGLSNPNIFNPVASPSETTTYTLTVTENGCSDTDTVTVIVDGSTNNDPPNNDDCNDAIFLTSSTSCNPITGTVAFATSENFLNDPSCDLLSNPNAFGVFYSFIAQSNTHSIFVEPSGNILDVVLTIYEGSSCNNLEEFDCDDTPNVGNATITNNNFIVGEQYWIRVYDYGTIEPPIGESGFSICVTHPNDTGGGGVDLISSIQSVSNNNPDAGDNIEVDFSVTNSGDENINNNFVSSLYISTNQNFGSADELLSGSVSPVFGLNQNQTENITVTVIIPSNLDDGQYYIVSVPDPAGLVDDIDEDNDFDFFPIQIGEIIENGPDLDVTDVDVFPNSNLAPGQEVNIEIEIDNEGNEDVDNFEVLIFLDIDNDGNFDSNEFMAEFHFGDIDAGDDKTKDRDVFLPTNIPSVGTYEIVVIADSNNEINETNEDNNDKDENITISTVNPAGPDLVTNFVRWEINGTNTEVSSQNLCIDTEYRLYWEIENIGNLNVPIGFQVSHRAFISTNPFLDGTAITFHFDSASSGQHNIGDIVSIDDNSEWEGVSPGQYYLLLVADEDEDVDEAQEGNNVTVIPITINNCNNIPLPDLEIEITNYTPYESALGDYITVDMTVTNIGNITATERIDIELFLSEDQIFQGVGNDVFLNDHQLTDSGLLVINDDLEPDQSMDITMTAYTRIDNELDPIVTTGIKYLFAVVDEGGEYIESDRDNNITFVPINLTSVDCYFNFDSTEYTQNTYTWEGNSFPQGFAIETEEECIWNLTSSESWIFIITPNGIGSDTVGFSLSENPTPFSRSGYILLNGEEFYEIIQDGKPCELLADDIKLQLEFENTTDIGCGILGSIDISVNQGFPPYTYQWSNGVTTQDLEDLTEGGVYTVTVTDVSGCDISQSFTINEGVFVDATVNENDNVIIANQNNAEYQWLDCSNGMTQIENETNQSFLPEISGEYAVQITIDDCTVISECISITCNFSINTSVFEYDYQEGTYTDTVETLTEGNCAWSVSTSNDWITLNNTSYNGTNNIEFILAENDTPFEREGMIIINESIEYTFIQLGIPCENLDESDQITISEINQVNIDCFESFGSIDITVENGFPPYIFNWSNGEETEDLENIDTAGSYIVIVTDSADCTYEESFIITENLEVDDNITIDGNVLTVNQTDATYQWLDCDNDSNPISGAIDQSYTATSTGNYAVEIIYGNCTVISDCVFIDVLSTDAIGFSEFKIFPNPTEGLLNIQLPKNIDFEEVKYQIYSLEGRLVMNGTISNQEQIKVIDMEKLSVGNYFLKLSSEDNSWTTQIIKK